MTLANHRANGLACTCVIHVRDNTAPLLRIKSFFVFVL